MTSTPIITTAAGSGAQGGGDDGGPATAAAMNNPFHVDIDPTGRFLYVADCFNYAVRRVDLRTSVIDAFAGCGEAGHSGDGGPAAQARIDEIYAVQVAPNGDGYILQRFNPAVRKIDAASGVITTVAGDGTVGSGGDGGPATRARMREPNDCALDGKGGLLIADVQDQRIRRLDIANGVITTFTGTGEKAHRGDGGKATDAAIFGARAVCADGRGNVYVCEREGNTIRRIDADNVITTVAGTGAKGYSGDGGPAIDCEFNGPKAIRCDADGNVLIVDTENHAVRRLDAASGIITTVAGGRLGPGGDGGPATEAGLARPHGAVADAAGAIYIADSENHRVRKVG